MGGFFSELNRRNVVRVGLAYLVVAWLLLQVADILVPMLELPDWSGKLVFLLLAIGFVPALVLAWAYELTPGGLKREGDVDRAESVTSRSGRRLDFIIIGLLAIALAYFIYESRVRDIPPPVQDAAQSRPLARSIAVLPFINIGNVAEDEYLCDGLAETLLNMLAQIEDLEVAARTSAFKFKGTNEDVRLIGEQLGVATVLEGSVQRSGDTIRITAQLIDVEDGFHLWSENYERTLDDIFVVQDDIAGSVVEALQLELLGPPQIDAGPDPAAYDALLRVREALRSRESEQIAAAIDATRALIDVYPDYADAYATLSEAYAVHAQTGGRIPEEFQELSVDMARKAVSLDPGSPRAHTALVRALVSRRHFVQAESVIDRAFELEPGSADLLMARFGILQVQGRYREAGAAAEQALRLDPLNDETRMGLAWAYISLGREEDALGVLEAGVMLEPGNNLLEFSRILRLQHFGRYAEAHAGLLALLEREPDFPDAMQRLFYLYLDLGDLAAAESALEQGEAMSESRLADERALLCVTRQDTDCWYAATELMVATRNQFFAQIWQSRMLMDQGRLEEAIEVLIPWLEHFEATDDYYGNLETRINLASLYDRAGDIERRDALLGDATRMPRRGIENGWDTWVPYYFLGLAAAVQGEAASAAGYLDDAYERGFRELWWFIQDYAWDRIRATAEFQSFVQRVETANAVMLEEIRAAQDAEGPAQ